MTTITNRGSRVAQASVLSLLATIALGLTACGGGSDAAATTAAGAANGGANQQQGGTGPGRGGGFGAQTAAEREKLQACLKKEGVSLPAGRGGPGGAPPTGTDGAPPAGGGTRTGGAGPSGADGAPPSGGGLPGGGGGAGGRGDGVGMTAAERKAFQAALKSCGVTTPIGGAGRGPDQGQGRPNVRDAAYRRSIRAYVACVEKNGFDLPAPNFSGSGPIFDPEKVDQDDASFKKASAACQSTLRQDRSSGGGASGSSDSTG